VRRNSAPLVSAHRSGLAATMELVLRASPSGLGGAVRGPHEGRHGDAKPLGDPGQLARGPVRVASEPASEGSLGDACCCGEVRDRDAGLVECVANGARDLLVECLRHVSNVRHVA